MSLENLLKDPKAIFDKYANADGKLSKEEMMELFDKEVNCPELKEKLCKADCRMIMRKGDKDGDGQINFDEFSRLVDWISKRCEDKRSERGQECGRKCE